ncbi:hypothetical protein HN51_032864 [Arachis hypogaea]
MHNGNLHNALLRRKSPELVRWQTRFSVALGVVRGLQFLHSCNPPVIHDDIKPINVLLDWSFAAKIGDFGLARFRTENRLEAEALSYESDENGGSSGVMLKDYVMDWIRNDVGMQRPKAELTASASAASTNAKDENNNKKKHKSNSSSSMRKLEWWESMDEDGDVLKKQRRRPVREWWKEEYSQDLA